MNHSRLGVFFVSGFFLFSDTHHYCQLLLPFHHFLPELLLHPHKQDHGRGWDVFFQHKLKSLTILKSFQKRCKEWQHQAQLSESLLCSAPSRLLSPAWGSRNTTPWPCLHPVSTTKEHFRRSHPDALPCAADIQLTHSPRMAQSQTNT